MSKKRRRFSAEFKPRVALEALPGEPPPFPNRPVNMASTRTRYPSGKSKPKSRLLTDLLAKPRSPSKVIKR